MIRISDTLSLPNDAVTQTFAFLARRGAGKSYGAMKLAEGMLDAGAQIVALDPVGVWYSLRIAADGKSNGYSIPIFGGLHGDVPLEPTAGAFIADLVVDRGISAVLDVSQMRKNDRKRFATEFAEQLFHRKKQRRSPLHVFVEEAQVFVPQQTMEKGGERDPKGGFFSQLRLLGAFEDIIKLGRNFGIGATLISQRPQSVNKDALNQTEALVVLQTNGAQERKALENWIVEQGVGSKSLVDELPGLAIGTAYLWSPSWLRKLEKIKIGRRKTYDASATPVAGLERVEPRPLAPDEFAEVEKAMATTIERAKADDPKALRTRIADLESELKARPTETRVVSETIEVPVFPPEMLAGMERYVAQWQADLREFVERHEPHIKALKEQVQAAFAARSFGPATVGRAATLARVQRPSSTSRALAPPARPERTKTASAGDDAASAVTSSEQRVLDAIATFDPEASTRRRIGILSGYSPKTGNFSNILSGLRTKGLIANAGPGFERLTDAGRALVPHVIAARPTSSKATIEMWLGRVSGGQAKLLRALVDDYPAAIARDELGERTGYSPKTGNFSNLVSSLRTLGLVDVGGGAVKAADDLFPTGAVR